MGVTASAERRMSGSDRRMQLLMTAGLLLVMLAWWCGPQSYGDLREYAQMCDNLWLHGTFANLDGQQSRLCWGFPCLMLPFRALGALLETCIGRNDLAHWVTALAAPVACLVVAALIARHARRVGLRPADAVLAALLTVLAAGALSCSRMFCLEPVVGALLISAVVLAEETRGIGKAAAAGVCLGAAFACHYANGACIAVLAVGLAWRILQRLGNVMPALALALTALAWVGLTALSNEARYGQMFTSGYNRSETVAMTAHELAVNIPILGIVFLMVPWFPAVLAWVLARGAALPRLLATAIVLQIFCWLWTWQFTHFPLRYLTPMIILGGFFVPDCLATIRAQFGRWSDFVISRGSAALLAWGFVAFLSTGGFCRPILYDEQHPLFPGQALAAMWYQPRAPYQYKGHYVWSAPNNPESETLYPERPLTGWSIVTGALLMACGG